MKKDGLAVEGEGVLVGNRFLTDHIIQAINITIRRSDTPFICQDILSSITNMIYSIQNWYLRIIFRFEFIYTPSIKSKLFWVRTSLMMCIDTALRAKVMFCCICIEFIFS